MDKTEPEFVFAVVKQKDGRIAIGNVEGSQGRAPTIDEIYAALSIVMRDIQVQQTVAGFAQVLGAAKPGPARTEGGVIVPEPTSKFKKVTRA